MSVLFVLFSEKPEVDAVFISWDIFTLPLIVKLGVKENNKIMAKVSDISCTLTFQWSVIWSVKSMGISILLFLETFVFGKYRVEWKIYELKEQ